jgi:hypothetical protein
LAEWQPSYKRGFAMLASLAILGFVLGVWAWWTMGNGRWLVGAIALVVNWPYTLLAIVPTNRQLMATTPAEAGPRSRALIERWGRPHAARTGLGVLAVTCFLWAAAA